MAWVDTAGLAAVAVPGTSGDPMPVLAPLTGADPRQLGGYRLLGRLGEGGMGTVYLGEAGDGTRVAVKMIRAEFAADPRFVARFRREGDNVRRVVPHCTARVLGADVDGGRPYLVTEYIPGPTLAQEVSNRQRTQNPFTQAEVEQLAVAILTALVAIHAAGVVHRDLKPPNVLLSPTGPRVIDFGIARALDASPTVTHGRSRVGTLGYMAPEQIRGEQVTPAADVFAWGATVIFAANAVGPFGVGDDVALMYRTLDEPPALGRLSPTLRPLVEQALSKNPVLRPPARALLDALLGDHSGSYPTPADDLATQVPRPSPPIPGPPPAPARRGRARRNILAAAVAVVLAAVAVVVIVNPFGRRSEGTSPPVLGACPQIEIFTGMEDAPYYRYGQVLERRIEGEFPGSAVGVRATSGSAENLQELRDPVRASCRVAITQLNIAVDARYGVYHFEGEPIQGLRLVGPLWPNLVQLIVRRDSSIHDAAGLCTGKTVATGPKQSGTEEIGTVLFRQVRKQVPGCNLAEVSRTLSDGLAALRAGNVDAVLWVGGVPTATVRNEISNGLAARLLPLDGYRAAMQEEWDSFYRSKLGSAFVPGDMYQVETTDQADYPGVGKILTVTVPNGVAVIEDADPALVRFVADSFFRDQADSGNAVWGDGQGVRHFPNAKDTVGTSPAYCLVPLHPAAVPYYQGMGINPPCPR